MEIYCDEIKQGQTILRIRLSPLYPSVSGRLVIPVRAINLTPRFRQMGARHFGLVPSYRTARQQTLIIQAPLAEQGNLPGA